MEIVIVKSRVTDQWGYCPREAADLLRPDMDDSPGFETSAEAVKWAKRDASIPKGATFTVIGE